MVSLEIFLPKEPSNGDVLEEEDGRVSDFGCIGVQATWCWGTKFLSVVDLLCLPCLWYKSDTSTLDGNNSPPETKY